MWRLTMSADTLIALQAVPNPKGFTAQLPGSDSTMRVFDFVALLGTYVGVLLSWLDVGSTFVLMIMYLSAMSVMLTVICLSQSHQCHA